MVLGGSKAAQDAVFNFMFRGYARTIWVFRRTYWGTNYYHTRVKYEFGATKGMQAWCRYILFVVRFTTDSNQKGVLSRCLVRLLHYLGFLLNPHPADYELGNFHGGIFDKARLSYIEKCPDQQSEIQELHNKSVLLKNGMEIPVDILICATGYKNEKVPVVGPNLTFSAHELDASFFFRGMILPEAPRVAFMNTLTLGNIANDSLVIGEWFVRCYLPLLSEVGDENVKEILHRSAVEQKKELAFFNCRSFNLWDAFDRPIPFMYHNLRRFKGEIKEPGLIRQSIDAVWKKIEGNFLHKLVYPLRAAAFLLASTESKSAHV